jgi:hypothetical protein
MTTTDTYKVRAEWEPWPEGHTAPGMWVLTVEGVENAVTQAAHLTEAAATVADLLSVMLDRDVPADAVDLVDIQVPGVADEAARARAARRQFETLAEEAQEATCEVIRVLGSDRTFTTGDIGVMVGLSGQRIRQLRREADA